MNVRNVPFRGATQLALFQSIVSCRVSFPAHISKEAKSLMRSLLKPEASRFVTCDQLIFQLNWVEFVYFWTRLGVKGAQEVREHVWFQGLDWNALRQQEMHSPILHLLETTKISKASQLRMLERQPSLVTLFLVIHLTYMWISPWSDSFVC